MVIAPCWVNLAGIRDQIEQHLPGTEFVTVGFGQPGRDVQAHINRLVFDETDTNRTHAFDHGFHVEVIQVQVHLTGVDLGLIQDVVDQAEQMRTAVVNGGEVLLLHFGQRAVDALQDHAAETDDRVQRRTQFMAHIRQEVALEAIKFAELFVGALHCSEQAVCSG